jgi:hypothetical protein
MESFDKQLCEYRKQLEKGTIKTAYQELMKYFDKLRLHLKNKQPDYFISDVHYGLMDYTYFYFFPKQLQRQKLKVVILFTHETFKFEILLAGYNRAAQEKYWKLFKENGFNKYHLTPTAKEPDRFIDSILLDNPDFSDLDALSIQIEVGALKFIKDIQDFLTKHQNP